MLGMGGLLCEGGEAGELASSVFIVLELIPGCTARREQDNIAGAREGVDALHRR